MPERSVQFLNENKILHERLLILTDLLMYNIISLAVYDPISSFSKYIVCIKLLVLLLL